MPTNCALVFVLCLVACGDDTNAATDAAQDQAADAATDTGGERDARVDDAAVQDAAVQDAPGADMGADGRDAGDRTDASSDDADAPVEAGPELGPGECVWLEQAGCGALEWCAPVEGPEAVGTCTFFGDADLGERCTLQTDCTIGTLCTERPDGLRFCERACDPAEGLLADCGAGQRCGSNRNAVTGEPEAVGICVPSCDVDRGFACTDTELACVPQEILSSEFDLCLPDVPDLPDGADCALAEIGRNQLCGPRSLCADRFPERGLQCFRICRESVAGIGLSNHPDCRNETDLCEFFAVGVGLCLSP
ncbi:MAG: hypothetical protein AAF411_15480 [Myxococcota bacterium]